MRKGFTLIELLVVIAIVAILSVVVILVINPAQLLAQARDSNRINDLQNIKTALATYMADVSSPNLGTSTLCYTHSTLAASCNAGVRYTTPGTYTPKQTQTTDGNGWIPVNLNAISSGSPLPAFPVDPSGNSDATYFYTYKPAAGNTFELTAVLESLKYATSTGPMGRDGGARATVLEIGTEPGLDL